MRQAALSLFLPLAAPRLTRHSRSACRRYLSRPAAAQARPPSPLPLPRGLLECRPCHEAPVRFSCLALVVDPPRCCACNLGPSRRFMSERERARGARSAFFATAGPPRRPFGSRKQPRAQHTQLEMLGNASWHKSSDSGEESEQKAKQVRVACVYKVDLSFVEPPLWLFSAESSLCTGTRGSQ